MAGVQFSSSKISSVASDTETIRSELMADMTHELKTPLASIKGYMEGLQDGVIPASDDTFQMVRGHGLQGHCRT